MIDLAKLADSCGIARDYFDVTNSKVTIKEENRIMALRLMGYPVDDQAKLEKMVYEQQRKPFADLLPPVTVIVDGDFPFIYLWTLSSVGEKAALTWTLTLEDGTTRTEVVPLSEVEIADYTVFDGQEYDQHRLILQEDLPYGYHHFSCKLTDGYQVYSSINMSLIRAPKRAYIPESMQQGLKVWGVSIQLYALRSKKNWGIGDFSDLKDLLSSIAECGGQFVGVNPLHAGYPSNPDPDSVSPYSPSSRRWLNVIYINVEDIPDYLECEEALKLVSSKTFQQKLKSLRDREYVDYHGVLELKLKVLRLIFKSQKVSDRRSLRGKKFLEFIEQGGSDLMEIATYDALTASLYAKGIDAWGMGAFPAEYQHISNPFVETWRSEHSDEVRFFCYLQFLAAEQLELAHQNAKAHGMTLGLYRDLAVGVGPGSCDVWSDKYQIYRTDASLGAPPDPLGPLGQIWGLSPMDPLSLRNVAYQPMIQLYRSNMRSCGALRIDHAAGLYRFWWVREGASPQTGAYVNNYMHDFMGIIALESQRHQCVIIAEDLGTIPQELREALIELGAYSYKLFFGERAYDGGYIDPRLYQPVAMAALTTHDMPTMKGWWEGRDLTLGQKLGLYTDEQAQQLLRDRQVSKQRILDSLHGLGSVGAEVPTQAQDSIMDDDLVKGLQVHMCRSACALYSSQLEDWIGVAKPVNVPGTFREYPNWRRKLTQDLDQIFQSDFVHDLTAAMTQARKH
ncbi:MAG: 4-alpha-glucanotransferase [Succinivibrio sp.]|nr:4-alpha-glucanotransferase [Succinivibrio sp.]